MKTTQNQTMGRIAQILELLFLVAAGLQLIYSLFGFIYARVGAQNLDLTKGPVPIILILFPVMLITAYWILRLYLEMLSMWRTVLAAIGYLCVCAGAAAVQIFVNFYILVAFAVLILVILMVFSFRKPALALVALMFSNGIYGSISAVYISIYEELYAPILLPHWLLLLLLSAVVDFVVFRRQLGKENARNSPA